MITPFFSIITCTYNSSKYLEENITSIKNKVLEILSIFLSMDFLPTTPLIS